MDHTSTLTWRQISQSISTLPLLFSRKTEIQLPRVFHPARGHCTAAAQFCGTELPLNNLELARTGLSQQKHHHKLETVNTSTTRSGSRHLLAKLSNCILHKIFKINAPLFDEELVNFLSFEGKVVLENSKHPQEQSH